MMLVKNRPGGTRSEASANPEEAGSLGAARAQEPLDTSHASSEGAMSEGSFFILRFLFFAIIYVGGHRLYCSTFPPWLTELEREVKFIEFGLVYIYTGDCPRRRAALHRLVSHVHGPRPPGRVASRGAHHRGGEHHKPKQLWHPRPGLQQPRPLVGTRKLHQRGWMANRKRDTGPRAASAQVDAPTIRPHITGWVTSVADLLNIQNFTTTEF